MVAPALRGADRRCCVIWRWTIVCGWLASAGSVAACSRRALSRSPSRGDLAQYGQWTRHRTLRELRGVDRSSAASLPPGTLVHGKLANGLSLENRIRPVFVGRGFGNYEDRKRRDDVRYILTYIAPSLGYDPRGTIP